MDEYRGPLTQAAAVHDLDQVEALLESDYVYPSPMRASTDRRVAMNTAVDNDDILIVDRLLDAGIKPTVSNFVTAIENQSTPILEIMLSSGYDINACDRIDWPPPLAKAVFDPTLVRWLIEHGANPNAQCRYDITPLSYAVSHGSKDVIKLFFELGASIEYGQPLHFAIGSNRDNDVIELLLAKGASPNEIMYKNHLTSYYQFECIGLGTALHGAVYAKNDRLIRLLLKHGADPMIRNIRGKLAQVGRDPFFNAAL